MLHLVTNFVLHIVFELNVGVVSVKVFVKIVDFVFAYGCKSVVDVA